MKAWIGCQQLSRVVLNNYVMQSPLMIDEPAFALGLPTSHAPDYFLEISISMSRFNLDLSPAFYETTLLCGNHVRKL